MFRLISGHPSYSLGSIFYQCIYGFIPA